MPQATPPTPKGATVIICGGRDYLDGESAFAHLDALDAERPILTVVEGGQRTRDPRGNIVGGADWWANQWAEARGKGVVTIAADWHSHGKSAGPKRNAEMARYAANFEDRLCVAFPGGRGTADMIRQARSADIEVRSPHP